MLLDSIVTSDTTERLVLSTARFLAPLPSAVRRAQLCPMAEPRVKALRALFWRAQRVLVPVHPQPGILYPGTAGAR